MTEPSWVVSWIEEEEEDGLPDGELGIYSLLFDACVTEEGARSKYARLKEEGRRVVILSRVTDMTAPPWFHGPDGVWFQ